MGAEKAGQRKGVLGENLRQILEQIARVETAVVVKVQLRDEARPLVQQHNLLYR